MGKKQALSLAQKTEIVTLRFKSPFKHTLKQISEALNISIPTIQGVCKRYDDRGDIKNHYNGHPGGKINKKGMRALKRMVKSGAQNRRSTLA